MSKRVGLIVLSALALVLFGGVSFFMRHLLFGGVVATYEEASSNQYAYSDQWISYDVVACLGNYAEYTESQFFIPTEHKYYYICWMEDGSMMPLCVSDKDDREYLNDLTDATYSYVNGDTDMIRVAPRSFVGTVVNQNRELKGYYDDYLTRINATSKDGVNVNYVVLDCATSRTQYLLLCGAVMLVPIGGFAVSIIGIVNDKKKQKNETETYLPR